VDLALPALTVLVLAAPGFTFRQAYLRGLRGLPVRPRAFAEEVAMGLLVSALLHTIAVAAAKYLAGIEVDFLALGRLLSSNYGSNGEYLAPTVAAVAGHWGKVFGYFTVVLAAAFGLGVIAHGLVRRSAGVRDIWLLGFRDDWHRLLTEGVFAQEANAGAPVSDVFAEVSAVVPMGKDDYVYRGVLLGPQNIRFDQNGELDRFILTAAARRKLSDDGNPDEQRFYEIKGDLFVLRYHETKTLNIRFLALVEESEAHDEGAAAEMGDPEPATQADH